MQRGSGADAAAYLSKVAGGGGGASNSSRMGYGTIGGGSRTSGLFANEPSEDREEQRKKEVDDLISKYASKKKSAKYGQQDWSQPSSTYASAAAKADYEPSTYSSLSRRNSQLYEPTTLDRTYASAATNAYSSAANSGYTSTYTQSAAAYPRDSSLSKYAVPVSSSGYQPTAPRRSSITSNDYGTYAADMYGATPKYSALSSSASTANVYSHMSTSQESAKPMSAARRYLNQSKSSSNLFLYPQTNALLTNNNGTDGTNGSLTRQQKTLSIHGIPSQTGTGSSNRIMPSGGSSSALYASLTNGSNKDDFLIERGSAVAAIGGSKTDQDWRQRSSKYTSKTSLIQPSVPVRAKI